MSVFIPLTSDPQNPPTPRPREDGVTTYARLAFVIWVGMSFAITCLVLLTAIQNHWDVATAFRWWVGCILTSSASTAILGSIWTLRYKVRRPLEIEDEERALKYQAQYAIPELIQESEPPAVVRIEIVDKPANNAKTTQWLDLPCSLEQLTLLSHGLVSGKPFTEAEWTGSGKPFSRGENGSFTRLREALINRKLMIWKDENNHNAGVEITRTGRAVFRHLSPTQSG